MSTENPLPSSYFFSTLLERIYVVPGNHDVDRSIIHQELAVQNIQAVIKAATGAEREQTLRNQLRNPDTGRTLFLPITAYNDFAKIFGCQIYPEQYFWKQELPIDDQTTLRIYGLTSTFLSGDADNRGSLYLSPLQTSIVKEDGVINLVMSHHPPDWFLDHDKVDSDLCNRASIHLFGHRHIQRITRDRDYIRFYAGAVNPERDSTGWDPGYNLIKLNTTEEDGRRFLNFEAYLLKWQENPEMFIEKVDSDRQPTFKHRLPIHGRFTPKGSISAPDFQLLSRMSAVQTVPQSTEEVDVEAVMSSKSGRNLIRRFWALTMSQRRDIALNLNLLDENEIALPEPERYDRALKRASERGILHRVIEEIERREQ